MRAMLEQLKNAINKKTELIEKDIVWKTGTQLKCCIYAVSE